MQSHDEFFACIAQKYGKVEQVTYCRNEKIPVYWYTFTQYGRLYRGFEIKGLHNIVLGKTWDTGPICYTFFKFRPCQHDDWSVPRFFEMFMIDNDWYTTHDSAIPVLLEHNHEKRSFIPIQILFRRIRNHIFAHDHAASAIH